MRWGWGSRKTGDAVTTEDDFQAALDANPGDWQTRLVFADWLQERGDPRADGYRALGSLRIAPTPRDYTGATEVDVRHWRWAYNWDHDGQWMNKRLGGNAKYNFVLPESWVKTVSATGRGRDLGAATRRETEDTAARAFAKLSPERRAEFLAAVASPKEKPARRKRKK
jgi:uncharacterized protein (TIGR02996 family)